MTTRRWLRSLPTVETVLQLVRENYPIEPLDAVLVRPFVNDVYRVTSREGSYALKIYGAGRFTADEIRWEQQLVRHLVDQSLAVAQTVDLRNGDCVGMLTAPEGVRPYALTDWLPGKKPQPPWTNDLYRRVGTNLARLHQALDSFRSDLPRRPIRSGTEPEQLITALADDPPRQQFVLEAATAARTELERLAPSGLRWAIRHGDYSLDNVHVDDAGELSVYDFDLAGPGWQVEDLAGALTTDFADTFLAAYTAVRPLSTADLEALPWLGIVAAIDNLHFHLVRKPRTHGTASLAEGWVDRAWRVLEETVEAAGEPQASAGS